jgi:signal transduction histidine kinase
VTRRITLLVLSLIAALLALAVAPLWLLTARHERADFRQGTQATDSAIAAAAEEHLSDHHRGTSMLRLLRQTHRRGAGCGVVYDAAVRTVATAACPLAPDGDGTRAAREVLRDARPRTVCRGTRLTVAVPVGDETPPVGVAVLVRSTRPLDRRLSAIGGGLALVCGGGMAAAVVLSAGLARWVGRPLREVDAAAGRLGRGDLDVRAPAGQGPPEVRRLATTFNTMAARMQALVHGHRAVVADVSHQLRTPLAALRLRLDLLGADADPGTAAELAGAQEEIARLSRLVDGLLAVARAENAVPRPVVVPVADVIAERVEAWRPVAAERDVTVTAHCPARLRAHLGSGDLEQVLDNLVANALDAVPVGGRVTIEGTAGPPGTVRVRVADDGPGMPAALRESAFRRFGSTTPGRGGAGLGLAIVHRLITANGGGVRLEETAGGGLTAVLDLPAAPGSPPSA